jgi:carboxyl-terminal processing protease
VAEAKVWVDRSCELGRRALGLQGTAVTLEFLFGACALDDYSGCLTPDRLADLYAEIDGNFVGIGVELKDSPRGLKVVHVLPGGPAAEGGLRSGDEIVAVEGKSLGGMALDPAAATLQGPEGSTFRLTVQTPGTEPREVALERRPVTVLSVEKCELFPGGIGFIRLTGFQKTTMEEMDRGVATLQAKGMRHLVLDLRGNPGGLLNVAVELADRFLDQGVIVSTRGRAPGQSQEYSDSSPAVWRMPVTVLIDRDSASASEILAGALKELSRAEIIGERSYGKGSVQSIYPFRSADAAIKLTTARFYSPRNRPYAEQGVEPDVVARAVAKPAADGVVPDPSQVFGDPESDAVLSLALRRAAGKSTTARRP